MHLFIHHHLFEPPIFILTKFINKLARLKQKSRSNSQELNFHSAVNEKDPFLPLLWSRVLSLFFVFPAIQTTLLYSQSKSSAVIFSSSSMCNTTPSTPTDTTMVNKGSSSSSSGAILRKEEAASPDIELGPQTPQKEAPSPSNRLSWLSLRAASVQNAKVLSACSFYSFCSVSMVLTNKSLASR